MSNINNHLIIRDSCAQGAPKYDPYHHLKRETCNGDNIIYGYAVPPQIAIKIEEPDIKSEVLLLNGCWDTSDKIPNIVADMADLHNIPLDDFSDGSPGVADARHHQAEGCSSSATTYCMGLEFLQPSPRSSDSGIESDCADGNLSWLLNYKIHELPPVPDTSATSQHLGMASLVGNGDNSATPNQNHHHQPTGVIVGVISKENYRAPNNKFEMDEFIKLPSQSKDAPPKTDDGKVTVGPNGAEPFRYTGPKKPPFTYTELIEHALSEKGELTVSGIYQWISEHFPFYKQNDDRWKNSVRHNLSINPHFRKGGKAVHGAGHLWTIAQRDMKKCWQIKQRVQQFIDTNNHVSIKNSHSVGSNKETNGRHTSKDHQDSNVDMELEAATASILTEGYPSQEFNGGKEPQQIQIEYIRLENIQDGLEDFLSPPVSKQQIVQECGLGNDFLITDLNPHALGLNLQTESNGGGGDSSVVNDGHFYDDISFEYYELEK